MAAYYVCIRRAYESTRMFQRKPEDKNCKIIRHHGIIRMIAYALMMETFIATSTMLLPSERGTPACLAPGLWASLLPALELVHPPLSMPLH